MLLSLLSACCLASAKPVTLTATKLADGFRFTEGPAADREGHVYFTDPLYKRPYWTHRDPESQLPRAVYRLSPDRVLHIADIDVKQPNGIVGTADGQTLFITASTGLYTAPALPQPRPPNRPPSSSTN